MKAFRFYLTDLNGKQFTTVLTANNKEDAIMKALDYKAFIDKVEEVNFDLKERG